MTNENIGKYYQAIYEETINNANERIALILERNSEAAERSDLVLKRLNVNL